MRGQRKNPRKAVQPFENKKRKIDIFKNYEANGVEKIQRKLEIFSTLISKKSTKSVAKRTKATMSNMTLSPSDVFAESSFFIRPPKKNPRRSKRRSEKSAGSLKMVFLFDVWEHHINDIKTFVRENVLTVFYEQCFDFRLCSIQRDNVI